MSSGDETYLEAFIEKITSSSLPHQLRRNLDLLRDLDATNGADLRSLRHLQRQYILAAEEKVLRQLEIVEMNVNADDAGEDGDGNMKDDDDADHSGQRYGSAVPLQLQTRPKYCVKRRRLGDDAFSGSTSVSTDEKAVKEDPVTVLLPTTQEFMDFISSSDTINGPDGLDDTATSTMPTSAQMYQQIRQLQQSCLQKADEKVAVAHQTYDLLDALVQRLDTDLAAMEQLLQSMGEFSPHGVTVKPNDLAACQVTPGVSEWILAKVIQHDPVSRMYKLADEDVESNKVFDLPDTQVVVLSGLERLSKGDVVFAVYPDTTSFYQATVVQAPRKHGGGGGGSAGGTGAGTSASSAAGQFLMVNFVDDADEFGITHDKAVPIQHVMLPPTSV